VLGHPCKPCRATPSFCSLRSQLGSSVWSSGNEGVSGRSHVSPPRSCSRFVRVSCTFHNLAKAVQILNVSSLSSMAYSDFSIVASAT